MEPSFETLAKQYEEGCIYWNSKFTPLVSCEETCFRIWESALNRFYDQFNIDIPLNIVIKWIEPGGPESGLYSGVGDLSHAIKTAKLFYEKFPKARVFLTNLFEDEEEEEDFSSDCGNSEFALEARTLRSELFLGILSPKYLLDYLNSYYPGVPCIMFDVATPKVSLWPFEEKHLEGYPPRLLSCIHIDEYNGHRTEGVTLQATSINHLWVSCGIGYDRNLNPAVGVHINQDCAFDKMSFHDLIRSLDDQDLARELMGGSGAIRHFGRSLYLNYSPEEDEYQWLRFIQASLFYEECSKSCTDVDFVLLTPRNKIVGIVEEWESIVKKEWDESSFRDVEIISHTGWVNFLTKFDLCHDGIRSIRIIEWTKRLSHEDMLRLMKASGRMIGVTGDQSWAEAASLCNRVILYQVMPWKDKFVSEMIAIAKHMYGKFAHLVEFLELMTLDHSVSDMGRTWVSDRMGEILCEEEFIEQHTNYLKYICQNYDVKQWLLGLVKRLCFHERNKGLRQLENRAFQENFQSFETREQKRFLRTVQAVSAQEERREEMIPVMEGDIILVPVSPYRQRFYEVVKKIFAKKFL